MKVETDAVLVFFWRCVEMVLRWHGIMRAPATVLHTWASHSDIVAQRLNISSKYHYHYHQSPEARFVWEGC